MTERREWMPLGEAFRLVARTPVIEERAEERVQAQPSKFLDLINLETEDAMSEAGLKGELQFRGLKTKYAKAPIPVPPEWFGVRARRWVRAPRGVDPETNELWFAPLHQAQDNNFVVSASFAAQEGLKQQRWLKVQVQTKTLKTFLKTLNSAMPEAAPMKRRPGLKAINLAIAKISNAGALVTERAILEDLRNKGYAPTRKPVRVAIKNSGLGRKAGRPSR